MSFSKGLVDCVADSSSNGLEGGVGGFCTTGLTWEKKLCIYDWTAPTCNKIIYIHDML